MKPKYTDHWQRHGKTHTRIYKIYRDMKSRCYNKNDYHYKWYGAKGVIICKEWLDDFMLFYDWSMENGYKDNLTIDRIDVNGNYEPSNCRWITHKEQCNNRHNSRYIEVNGVVKTISQWCEIYAYNGINKSSVMRRYNKGVRGEALFAPLKIKMHKSKIAQYDLNGNLIRVFDNAYDIKRELGFNQNPIYSCCHHKKFCHTAYGYKWEYYKD